MISSAVLTQVKGWQRSFQPSIESFDGADEVFDGREGAAADGLPGDDSEDLDHVEPAAGWSGVKCIVTRGFLASHALTFGCLWVA